MFNLFKKKKSNNELLNRWLNFSRENGFSDGQILGLAYFNSAIPTVLANVNQDHTVVLPLKNVINDLDDVSSEGANVFCVLLCINPAQKETTIAL
jgi:hypothetical protein